MKELLKEARNKIKYLLKTKGKGATNLVIDEIPQTWTKFLNTEDEWVELIIPESENASACIYKMKKGSIFPAHYHQTIEQIIIINEGGKLEIYTPSKSEVINYPNGAHFNSEEPHYVEALEDSIMIVLWHPKFEKGWEGDWII